MLGRLVMLGLTVYFLAIAAQLGIGVAIGEVDPSFRGVLAYGVWAAVVSAIVILVIGALPAAVVIAAIVSKRSSKSRNVAKPKNPE